MKAQRCKLKAESWRLKAESSKVKAQKLKVESGVSLAAAGTAGFISLQPGRDLKSGSHGGIHEIDFYGFNAFKEIFIDHESHSLFCKNDIVIP